jgi:hypothetical protein
MAPPHGCEPVGLVPSTLLRPNASVLMMVMSLLGTLAATVGGLVLVADEPSLEDFAWLFVGAQGAGTLGVAVATEVLFRQDPVFRPAGGV